MASLRERERDPDRTDAALLGGARLLVLDEPCSSWAAICRWSG